MPVETLSITVVDLVDQWATKTPHATAAEWQGEVLTYAELRNASLYTSSALLSAGVVPGAKIPLLTQMSLEMLPAIIGILRTGACYVPIDVAAWSRDRISAAIEAVSSPIILATGSVYDLSIASIVRFEKEWLRLPFNTDTGLYDQLDSIRRGQAAEDFAYVIFTSGTTGKPKGVIVPHRAIYNLVSLKEGNVIKITPEKRILLTFSIAFDGCAGIVWSTLTNGGTLVMASSSDFPERAATCQTLILTPSMLATLSPSKDYISVQEIFLGGEAPSLPVVRQWITPTRKVFNAYGPSEATVAVTVAEMDPDEEPTLGDVIPGVTLVLVDEDMQEAELGEIMIAGPCLAVGYMGNPKLTAKKFIEWHGERFYRTGDRAKRTDRGLVWAGRVDRLVKNRGFLVNLESEVEPALSRFGPVRAAAAFIWRNKLIGCVQPEDVPLDELRAYMKKNFDHFIVPDELLAMKTFPLTTNGKVNLDAIHAQLDGRTSDDELLSVEQDMSAYDILRFAFSSVLHVSIKGLGEDSSFMKLGGNSLTAIKVSQLLRKHGYQVSIAHILKADTIGLIKDSLTREDESSAQETDQALDSRPIPMTDMQKVMVSQSQKDISRNCILLRLKYRGPNAPLPSELQGAFTKVLSRHSIFKTRFDFATWTQSSLGKVNLSWKEVIADEPEYESTITSHEDQVWSELEAGVALSLDIPYCNMTCISVPDRKAVAIIWQVHHVLTDGFSNGLILQDLGKVLSGVEEQSAAPRYGDFALFYQQYRRDNFDRAVQHWTQMLEPLITATPLAIPAPKAPAKSSALVHIQRFPTAVNKQTLDAAVHALSVSPATLVFAAWALALRKTTDSSIVSFSLSLSGRLLPWPSAPFLAGSMNVRAPFCTSVLGDTGIHGWLGKLHAELVDVSELQNLCASLPEDVLSPEDTTVYFNTMAQSFIGMDAPSDDWEIRDMQRPWVPLVWQVYAHRQEIVCALEIDTELVDLTWAQKIGAVTVRMLEELVVAKPGAIIMELLQKY